MTGTGLILLPDAVERMSPDSTESRTEPTSRDRRAFLQAGGALPIVGLDGVLPDLDDERRRRTDGEEPYVVTSPDGRLRVAVRVESTLTDARTRGRPSYEVFYDGDRILAESGLGLAFRNMAPLDRNLAVVDVERSTVDERWEPVWDATDEVRNHHRELRLTLEEAGPAARRLVVVFRAFDDGLGFRYRLPEQPGFERFVVTDERTEFRFTGDHTAWWIPPNYDSYQSLYDETPLSEVYGANTPVTMRASDVDGDPLYLSLHEANLHDYAGMTVRRTADRPPSFESDLVPLPDGTKVKADTPHRSPWRTVTVGRSAGDLVESKLLLNLNPPREIDDPEWIEPDVYMGIWWEIHTGKSTWAPGPELGATTENVKRYIDFASDHDIPMVLAEGWNEGWGTGDRTVDGAVGEATPIPFSYLYSYRQDFAESNDRFDLEEVVEYGKERGVDFVAHAETAGHIDNFEEQMHEAFRLYEELGIPALKTGYAYVSATDEYPLPEHRHHDQYMVNHYQRVVEAAADHEIMLNVHEPIKPTGKRRTWPNLMTGEGVQGMEFNAWSDGNPPGHTVTVPFTRMLAGPVDYTPGIFEITYNENYPDGADGEDPRVDTTLAHQLALYPILFSGLQMAADLPRHYEGEAAFEFIENVPAAWDETKVVDAEIARYASVARRRGEEWYVGTATDASPRVVEIPLEFLDPGREYVAHVYRDAPETDLEDNPTAIEIERRTVTADDTIEAGMAGGGGHAVRLVPRDDRNGEPAGPPEERPATADG